MSVAGVRVVEFCTNTADFGIHCGGSATSTHPVDSRYVVWHKLSLHSVYIALFVEASICVRSRSVNGPFPLCLRRLHRASADGGDVGVTNGQTRKISVHRRWNAGTLLHQLRTVFKRGVIGFNPLPPKC